jgi:hypothetical protein
MIVVTAAAAGTAWAAITEWQSAKLGFFVLSATLGAIGGLAAYFVLKRFNNSLKGDVAKATHP